MQNRHRKERQDDLDRERFEHCVYRVGGEGQAAAHICATVPAVRCHHAKTRHVCMLVDSHPINSRRQSTLSGTCGCINRWTKVTTGFFLFSTPSLSSSALPFLRRQSNSTIRSEFARFDYHLQHPHGAFNIGGTAALDLSSSDLEPQELPCLRVWCLVGIGLRHVSIDC